MSDDIAERLRAGEACIDAGGKAADCSAKNAASGCLCAMAADKIERLQDRNALLEAAHLHWEHQNGLLEAEIERLRAALQAIYADATTLDEAQVYAAFALNKSPSQEALRR